MRNKDKLPDFIIVGGMKCGTTSLYRIINSHEKVYMPNTEIFFFDLDDEYHGHFFVSRSDGWIFQDYEKDQKKYLEWYRSFFRGAGEGQIIGEKATTYISSRRAPRRIASLLPDVKLIFMLRDPTHRAYSHYWHAFRNGGITSSFENTLQYYRDSILQRGCYKDHIERFFQYFSRDQMKFIIFEDFINNTQRTTDNVCDFIGLVDSVDVRKLSTHENRGVHPRFPKFLMLLNSFSNLRKTKKNQLFLPAGVHGKYPGYHSKEQSKPSLPKKIMKKAINRLLSDIGALYPPMLPATKTFLEQYYAKENFNLSSLTGQSLKEYWPYMDE